MYQSHWGLRETPYRDGLDVRFFHQSPMHDEALARLHFLVEERRRVGLLLGPSGSGKSLLLEVFARELRRKGKLVANIDLLGIEPRELLWQTAAHWGVPLSSPHDAYGMWRCVTDRLLENRLQRLGTVLLADNADEASPETLTHLVRLAQADPSSDAVLTVVLSARADRAARLGARLLNLAMLRIELTRWDETDTIAYLTASLAQAGRAAPAFNAAAMKRIHKLSAGIPRRVSQLADLALMAGAGQQLAAIDPGTIDAVYQELGVMSMTPQ